MIRGIVSAHLALGGISRIGLHHGTTAFAAGHRGTHAMPLCRASAGAPEGDDRRNQQHGPGYRWNHSGSHARQHTARHGRTAIAKSFAATLLPRGARFRLRRFPPRVNA